MCVLWNGHHGSPPYIRALGYFFLTQIFDIVMLWPVEHQQTWCKQRFEKQLSPLLSLESLEPWDLQLNMLERAYWSGHVEEN